MSAYDDAVVELYQAPLPQFIAERKRLAGELKVAGDKTGARVLGQRARPPISAWVVNQLWWHARDAFEELLATASRLRKGELAASAAHRDAIAKLRKRAAAMLEDAGHAATESTLRRVTTTLSALAATGSFDPDPPGALSADRDPPGFEAVGIPSGPIEPAPKPAPKHAPKDELAEARAKRAAHKPAEDDDAEAAGDDDDAETGARRATHKPAKDEDGEAAAKHEREEAAARRAEEIAEKKREEAEAKRRAAEKHHVEAALRTAKTELHEREREVKSLEKQLHAATAKVDDAQELVSELEKKLEELRDS